MTEIRWLADCLRDGHLAFRIGRAGDELVAEWIDTFRLVARRDGSVVEMVDAPGADPRSLHKIRRGGVPLLLRHAQGKLAFHGAVVSVGSRAIVFLGRSGHGKSTIAAAMCVRRNARLLADDAVVIDETPSGYVVTPSESDHWLDGAAREALGLEGAGDAKIPIGSSHAAAHQATIAVFVDLVFDDTVTVPRVRTLEGVEAMACLVPQLVRFVLDEPAVQRRELESLVRLLERVPVVRLERARRFDLVDAALEVLMTSPLLMGSTS